VNFMLRAGAETLWRGGARILPDFSRRVDQAGWRGENARPRPVGVAD
jgi:hypothetical protein